MMEEPKLKDKEKVIRKLTPIRDPMAYLECVGDQVAMADHHTFGRSGGPAGVLDQSQRLGVHAYVGRLRRVCL